MTRTAVLSPCASDPRYETLTLGRALVTRFNLDHRWYLGEGPHALTIASRASRGRVREDMGFAPAALDADELKQCFQT